MVYNLQHRLLILLTFLQLQCCCHSFVFLTPLPRSGVGRDRKTVYFSADVQSTSSPTTTSIERSGGKLKNIIASCPDLGGDIIQIRTGPDDDEEDEESHLTRVGVPTFAVIDDNNNNIVDHSNNNAYKSTSNTPKRLGLEGILHNSNAFLLENALSSEQCESILHTCEDNLKFGTFNAGKNNHGAMQIVISKAVADRLLRIIGPYIDLEGVVDAERELKGDSSSSNAYALAGINRRFRVYRYIPNDEERFSPHIDAGFPPGGSSLDDDDKNDDDDDDDDITTPYLHWDASHQYSSSSEVVSRLTVLIYLNEDFVGGHTKFYQPLSERSSDNNDDDDGNVIASIKPRAGSILVFPQAIGEDAVEKARYIWPLHEGSPVDSLSNRPKYVIRTDVLFESVVKDDLNNLPEQERVLFQHDDAVRNAFLDTSPMFSSLFKSHVQTLYNPHMGVENAGPLLYSMIRFTKCRNIVEVGAGYTTLFILQALKDNDDEMKRVVELDNEGQLKMLDYPFGTPRLEEWDSLKSATSSSLLCIDNCIHQKETATGAVGVSRTLGLSQYLQFLKGDAFDALDTHFEDVESIDLLWCDFGVGARMTEYASNVWKYIKPGGFLVCHSTLTNARTREWLEGIRGGKGEEITGIPVDEYVELSLLEPHKRFQNSLSILQKRVHADGKQFSEPIYSEYA